MTYPHEPPSPLPQVKLFGSFTRWAQDMAPPLDGGAPGRSILTTAAAALRYATTSPAGPVHINMQVGGVGHSLRLVPGAVQQWSVTGPALVFA